MTEQILITHTDEEVFLFLDDLRESGDTNMYGSGPYIRAKFGCGKTEATKLFIAWTESFAERHGL